MKGIAAAIVLMWMTTASAAEIRCQDAPGREQNGVFWSWREIEGNHSLKTAGMTDYVCTRRAAPADIPSRRA